MHWLFFFYKWCKKWQPVNRCLPLVMGTKGLLMGIDNKGCPASFDTAQQLLKHKLLKKMNAGFDRKVAEHRLFCMGRSSCQSVHADPCPLLKAPKMVKWSSKLNQKAMEEGVLDCWITFLLHHIVSLVIINGGGDGMMMHQKKKVSQLRQGDAMGNVLPGKLGRYFDTYSTVPPTLNSVAD